MRDFFSLAVEVRENCMSGRHVKVERINMDSQFINIFALIVGFSGILMTIYIFWKYIFGQKKSLVNYLENAILRFEPENRYLIVLSSTMTDKEFDEVVALLSDALDLVNADTYVAIMHGDVHIVTFS